MRGVVMEEEKKIRVKVEVMKSNIPKPPARKLKIVEKSSIIIPNLVNDEKVIASRNENFPSLQSGGYMSKRLDSQARGQRKSSIFNTDMISHLNNM